MKRLFCLLLAVVLTVSCLAGVCFAEDPIAVVIHGTDEIPCSTNEEIKALIDPDGTTVVKMLKDFTQPTSTFIYGVPSFTLDLNGHTAGAEKGTAIGVKTLGTENTTTVVKNGTLVAGGNASVCINIQVGGFRAENVTFISNGETNAAVGIYQLKGDWNKDNLITGCTLLGNKNAAIAFNSTTDSQAAVSMKIENTTLLNTRHGAAESNYPLNVRQVKGGTIELGKNVKVYSPTKMDPAHPDMTLTGETLTYRNGESAFKAGGMEFMNMHLWETPEGGMKNATMEVIQNVKAEAATPAAPATPATPPATAAATFKDVPTTFWGFDAIDAAMAAGLVKGKSTNSDGSMNYAPNDTMTRAEFVTTILRLFYADEAAKVSQNGAKWWTGYYELALAKNILKAAELDNGAMDKPMTREEMALVLHRTAPTLKGYASVKKAATSNIPDYKTVTNTYKDAVLWVYGAGLIQGMDQKGTFAPQNSLTRAQSATVLAKLVRTKNAGVEITLPVQNVPETAENRQKAMVETAMAYYNKGVPVQYDWIQLSRAGKEWGARYHADTKRNAPEYASADMTMYSVCSAFGSMVSMHSFGFQPLGHMNAAVTKDLSIITPEAADGTFVYQYYNTGDTAKDAAAMAEYKSLLQPGDLVTYTTSSGYGHTMIYTYDVTGDNRNDLVHCSDRGGGGRYDVETGLDKKEVKGGIVLNSLNEGVDGNGCLFTPGEGAYLGDKVSYSLLRPAQLDPAKYPMTEEAKTRLTYPGLTITYTTDTGFFGAVQKGQYITYTLVLGNKSKQDHKGLKVQVPTLDTATLTHVDGKEFKENLAVLTVDVPAGKEVTHTFTFKALGDVGSKVVSTGYVHAIALPEMHIGITAYTPTTEQFQAAATDAVVKAANPTDAFAEAYYKAALGKTVDIPDFETMVASAFSNKKYGGTNYYTPLDKVTSPLAKMVVTDYYGGRNVREDVYESHHVLETRSQDILPGDLLYVLDNMGDLSTAAIWLFNGQSYVALENGTLRYKSSLDVMKLHSYDFFCLVRPSQLG